LELAKIDSFALNLIGVVLNSENAEKLGVSSKGLTEYLRLKCKNNLAEIPLKNYPPEDMSAPQKKDERDKIGMIVVAIWTKGDDYPVAYYMEYLVSNLNYLSNNLNLYKERHLSYISKEHFSKRIKEEIGAMTEAFAIRYFKARGEM
jgi:hypothetical protein